MTPEQERILLEKLSEIEHEQWKSWARHIMNTESISDKVRTRWESYMVSYKDLSVPVQDLDRRFAKQSLEVFKKFIQENYN